MRDGRETSVAEVAARIDHCRPFIAGRAGEWHSPVARPLPQPAFRAEILRRRKELGLHTALATSGFLGAGATDELLAGTDLVLLDIKSFDVRTYRKLIGGELSPSLSRTPPCRAPN